MTNRTDSALRAGVQAIIDKSDADGLAYDNAAEYCGGGGPDETIEALRDLLRSTAEATKAHPDDFEKTALGPDGPVRPSRRNDVQRGLCAICLAYEPAPGRAHVRYGGEPAHLTCVPYERARSWVDTNRGPEVTRDADREQILTHVQDALDSWELEDHVRELLCPVAAYLRRDKAKLLTPEQARTWLTALDLCSTPEMREHFVIGTFGTMRPETAHRDDFARGVNTALGAFAALVYTTDAQLREVTAKCAAFVEEHRRESASGAGVYADGTSSPNGLPQDVVDLVDERRAKRPDAEPNASPSCERFHVHPDEWDALVALAHTAGRYHRDCGHDVEGAAAQCDSICEAWKTWKRANNPDEATP